MTRRVWENVGRKLKKIRKNWKEIYQKFDGKQQIYTRIICEKHIAKRKLRNSRQIYEEIMEIFMKKMKKAWPSLQT